MGWISLVKVSYLVGGGVGAFLAAYAGLYLARWFGMC
jgi:hypothetical protein